MCNYTEEEADALIKTCGWKVTPADGWQGFVIDDENGNRIGSGFSKAHALKVALIFTGDSNFNPQ